MFRIDLGALDEAADLGISIEAERRNGEVWQLACAWTEDASATPEINQLTDQDYREVVRNQRQFVEIKFWYRISVDIDRARKGRVLWVHVWSANADSATIMLRIARSDTTRKYTTSWYIQDYLAYYWTKENDGKYDTYYNEAKTAYLEGRHHEAIALWSEFIELYPRMSHAYMWRGDSCLAIGDYQAAIEDCSKAIQLHDEFPVAYWIRALSRFKLANRWRFEHAQLRAAAVDFRRIVDLEPVLVEGSPTLEEFEEWAEVCDNLALELESSDSCWDRGDFIGAEAACDRAIEVWPACECAYFARALCRMQLATAQSPEDGAEAPELTDYQLFKLLGAIDDFTVCVKADPMNPQYYALRATVHERLGNYALATQDWAANERLRNGAAETGVSGSGDSHERTFAEIIDQYNASVFLVYVEYPLLNAYGQEVGRGAGFGTAWLARVEKDRGWAVTNRHVIQPYLFDRAKLYSFEIEGITPDHNKDNWTIVCWPHGSLLHDSKGSGKWKVDQSWASGPGIVEGGKGGASIKGYAPDLLEPAPTAKTLDRYLKENGFDASIDEDMRKKLADVEVHSSSTNDLCVIELTLRDGGAWPEPLPLATNTELQDLHQLDSVLALGYPLGMAPIRGSRVTTSPATGEIRSVQLESGVIGISVPIHPGNSGGPLLDRGGRTIGVTTRGWEETISEAISIDKVRKLLEQLAK
ncbi:MAG: trypsin-like peptidase domain-containing protein [Planctomycetaceae bacterium]|nr:trypsin-like peptidase domain-containing protein [Planctomycetaceae bacterium]